jgi:hypothetical protein
VRQKLTETNTRGETEVQMMCGIDHAETNARGETDVNMMWGIKFKETNARGETDVNMMGFKLTETNSVERRT